MRRSITALALALVAVGVIAGCGGKVAVNVSSIAPATQANGRPRETLDYLAELPVPAVIMDHWGINLPITGIDCVLSDNYAGTYQATVHMIRHGYRKISVAQGDPASSPEMSERNRGYVSALTDHGLKVPDLPRISTDDLGRGRLDALKKHLEWGTQGFVVGNDRSASTMIRRLTEMGYKVPEQIGVIGYDDEPFATALCPKLSSVRVEKGEIARRAVGMLRERIETGSKGRHKMVVLRPTVVVRQSCGPNCPDPYVPDLEEFTEVDQLEASALV